MSTEKQTLAENLTDWVSSRLKTLCPEVDFSGIGLDVSATTDERFGDYQCNAAMALAKRAGCSPRHLAEQVAGHPPPPLIARIEVAGPGFINFFLDTAELERLLLDIEADERLGVPNRGAGRTIVLDYSSPNVAKPMHIGHIRSTVIGHALDRLHRFAGYRVIADSHLGDWGTQFGLLLAGYKEMADEQALERDPIEELERIYRASYARSQEDPAWLDRARAELVRLQQGDSENTELWQRFIAWSKREFDAIYERLGVSFDLERGESYYNNQLPGVLERLRDRGLLTESEGALVVDLADEDLPVSIVRKRDGGFNYTTTDLATAIDRYREFQPDSVIYVTDERQQLHFRQVFAILRKLEIPIHARHVWFGLMRLPDATFSTREGNVIKLERLLDEAERRAFEMVSRSRDDWSEEQCRQVARAVGMGAVKYADLSQNPRSTVTFTWEKALSLEGNSAPYLQYAYARIASVQDRYRERFPDEQITSYPMLLTEPIERKLALHLLRFPDHVLSATRLCRPSLLADYLYELAQTYSTFYQTVPFLKAGQGPRESRVRLCGLVARVLRQGLDLLGIETPSRI